MTLARRKIITICFALKLCMPGAVLNLERIILRWPGYARFTVRIPPLYNSQCSSCEADLLKPKNSLSLSLNGSLTFWIKKRKQMFKSVQNSPVLSLQLCEDNFVRSWTLTFCCDLGNENAWVHFLKASRDKGQTLAGVLRKHDKN